MYSSIVVYIYTCLGQTVSMHRCTYQPCYLCFTSKSFNLCYIPFIPFSLNNKRDDSSLVNHVTQGTSAYSPWRCSVARHRSQAATAPHWHGCSGWRHAVGSDRSCPVH